MERTVAQVERERSGSRFEAAIANLTPLSLVLVTEEALQYGEPLSLVVLGLELRGVVAFVLPQPYQGAVVAFSGSKVVRETLEKSAPRVMQLGPRADSTTSGLNLGAVEEAKRELEHDSTAPERAGDAAAIDDDPDTLKGPEPAPLPEALPPPPIVHPRDDALITASEADALAVPANVPVQLERHPNLYDRPPLLARPKSKKDGAEPKPLPPRTPSRATARMDPPTQPEVARWAIRGDVGRYPALDADRGVIAFNDCAHFREHYESTVRHGALVVRSTPLRINALLSVAIVVEGQPARVAIQARVALIGKDGTVGLTIESYAKNAGELAALASAART